MTTTMILEGLCRAEMKLPAVGVCWMSFFGEKGSLVAGFNGKGKHFVPEM